MDAQPQEFRIFHQLCTFFDFSNGFDLKTEEAGLSVVKFHVGLYDITSSKMAAGWLQARYITSEGAGSIQQF